MLLLESCTVNNLEPSLGIFSKDEPRLFYNVYFCIFYILGAKLEENIQCRDFGVIIYINSSSTERSFQQFFSRSQINIIWDF